MVAEAAPTSAKSTGREFWGLQALFMLISFFILLILFREAMNEVNGSGQISTVKPASAILRMVRGIQHVIPRLSRAIEPDLMMKSTGLSDAASVWAMVCVIGNIINAIILFLASLLQNDRHKLRLLIGLVSAMSILLSVATVPLVLARLVDSSGAVIPIDLSVISVVIYGTYLVSDILAAYDHPTPDGRANLILLMVAIDLPCLLAVSSLSSFGLLTDSSPEFSTGASAGLLIYSSLAFLLVSTWFWLKGRSGETVMNTLRGPVLIAIAVGAALNATIGFGIVLLKLPIYLDTLGSITIALLFGPLAGVISALVGSVANGLLTTPITIAYAGTAVGVTAAASYLTRWGFGKRLWPSVILGTIVLGPLSSLLSIPITTYLFSGVTFTGSDLITALILASGHGLLASVATGAVPFDAMDKGLTSLLCFLIVKNAPKTLLQWRALL